MGVRAAKAGVNQLLYGTVGVMEHDNDVAFLESAFREGLAVCWRTIVTTVVVLSTREISSKSPVFIIWVLAALFQDQTNPFIFFLSFSPLHNHSSIARFSGVIDEGDFIERLCFHYLGFNNTVPGPNKSFHFFLPFSSLHNHSSIARFIGLFDSHSYNFVYTFELEF